MNPKESHRSAKARNPIRHPISGGQFLLRGTIKFGDRLHVLLSELIDSLWVMISGVRRRGRRWHLDVWCDCSNRASGFRRARRGCWQPTSRYTPFARNGATGRSSTKARRLFIHSERFAIVRCQPSICHSRSILVGALFFTGVHWATAKWVNFPRSKFTAGKDFPNIIQPIDARAPKTLRQAKQF